MDIDIFSPLPISLFSFCFNNDGCEQRSGTFRFSKEIRLDKMLKSGTVPNKSGRLGPVACHTVEPICLQKLHENCRKCSLK